MFSLSEKRKYVLISIITILLLILTVVGCGTKEDDILSLSINDDGEAPQAPEILNIASQYLYSQEEDPDSVNKHYAVLIQWKKVDKNIKGDKKENIIGYRIYRDNRNTPIGSVDKDVTIFEDFDYENLREGSRYTYYISAIDTMRRETFSEGETVRIQVTGIEPQRPENFYVVPAENNVAVLCWDKPANAGECQNSGDPICKYKIKRKASNSNAYTTIAVVPADTYVFFDDTIIPGLTYSYRVYAVTTSGNVSPASYERNISFHYNASEYLARPTAPEGLRVTKISSEYKYNLEWDPPLWDDDGTNGSHRAEDIVAYRVYRAESDTLLTTDEIEDLEYRLIKILDNREEFSDSTMSEDDFSQKYYYYRVSAVNSKGLEGDMSFPAYYSTNSSTHTETPNNFSCIVDNDGYITFYFNHDSNIGKYILYKSLNGRYYEKYYEINSSDMISSSTDETSARFTLPTRIEMGDRWYFKLSAYSTIYTFRSNMTYYVKAERYSLVRNSRYIIQAEDLVNAVEVRDVHYAWYANYLYPNSDVAKDSLWNYDIRRGEHYYLIVRSFTTEDGKSGTALYFDPMGNMHPPKAVRPAACFGATVEISDEITISSSDYILCDLITTETRTIGGMVYIEDTARPLLAAKPQIYSGDSFNYWYITTYNDDGYTYWRDLDNDGVSQDEFYYRETQMPLLKHGMSGGDLRLDYDVDPWTHREPQKFGNIYLSLYDDAGVPIYDFWPTVLSSSSNPGKAWDTNDFDWLGGNGMGGCAYYIGPDSNTQIMVKDYFAEGRVDFDNFRIIWRENYFGGLYSNSYPGYAGFWPSDAYSWFFKYPEDRPLRKDNCLSYNLNGDGINYEDPSYIEQLDRAMYDAYQKQFRFMWSPPESGRYAIKIYFFETTNSGRYLVTIKQGVNFIGSSAIIDLSRYGIDHRRGYMNVPTETTNSPYDNPNAKTGYFEGYLFANTPVMFIFSPIACGVDVFHDSTYDFSNGSPFALYLDRIEIEKLED